VATEEWLIPPDFIEKAAQSEEWGAEDWRQWHALQERLETLGAKSLRLDGNALLIADGSWTFERSSVRFDPEAPGTPTLGAVVTLAHQLAPNEFPFTQRQSVLARLDGGEEQPPSSSSTRSAIGLRESNSQLRPGEGLS
jgi:hypothetical protein